MEKLTSHVGSAREDNCPESATGAAAERLDLPTEPCPSAKLARRTVDKYIWTTIQLLIDMGAICLPLTQTIRSPSTKASQVMRIPNNRQPFPVSLPVTATWRS